MNLENSIAQVHLAGYPKGVPERTPLLDTSRSGHEKRCRQVHDTLRRRKACKVRKCLSPDPEYFPEYQVVDQIRKWRCHFDGRNAFEFLERVEELREAYGFVDSQLLRGLPDLLRGEGLLWYRSITRPNTWDGV
jgi:hypothetical protein